MRRQLSIKVVLFAGMLASMLGMWVMRRDKERRKKLGGRPKGGKDAPPIIDQEEEQQWVSGAEGNGTKGADIEENGRSSSILGDQQQVRGLEGTANMSKAIVDILHYMEQEQVKGDVIQSVSERLAWLEEEMITSQRSQEAIGNTLKESLRSQQQHTNASIEALKREVTKLKAEMERIVSMEQQLAQREGVLEEKLEASNAGGLPIPHSPESYYGITDFNHCLGSPSPRSSSHTHMITSIHDKKGGK